MFKSRFARRALYCKPLDDFGGGGGDGSGSGGSLPNGGNLPGLEGGTGGTGGLPQSNPWDSVPKSWAQEHHAHWERVTPEVRQILHKREADVEKGIRSYAGSHQNWSRLSKHFEGMDPNLDSVGVYENLAQNHLALLKASPEDRREMLGQLAKYYGVDFAQQMAQASQPGQGPDLEKQLAPIMQKYLQPFAQRFQAMDQQSQASKQAETKKAVDAFFSDSKNEFITEVAPDVVELLKSGQVSDLNTAYEMACLRSPTVRAKYLAKLAQPAEQDGGKSSASRNVKSTGDGAPSGKGASMDDTMKSIVQKHYGRVR